MELTVKAAQVVKTGTNKNGDWELIRVTSEDGTEYTTFDKKAKHLSSGAVIDIGDLIIKEGKLSFKELKVISEGQVSSDGNGNQMTPEAWAEKDRREQWSRECNTCFMGIMGVAQACIEKETKISGMVKFTPVYDAALDWAMAHLQIAIPTKPVTKPKPQAPADLKQAEQDIKENWPEASAEQGKPSPDAPEPAIKPVKEEPSSNPFPKETLYQLVADVKKWKDTKPVYSWLINGPCQITEDRIENDPKGVWEEIKGIL